MCQHHVNFPMCALSAQGEAWLTTIVSVLQRSAEDIEVARARAAKDLVNIDSDERRRRVIFGSILTVGSPHMLLGHKCTHDLAFHCACISAGSPV